MCVLCLSTQVIGGAIKNDFIHLWPCAMLVAGLMLAFKCMSADQARNSVEWSIYVRGTRLQAPCHGMVTVVCCRIHIQPQPLGYSGAYDTVSGSQLCVPHGRTVFPEPLVLLRCAPTVHNECVGPTE